LDADGKINWPDVLAAVTPDVEGSDVELLAGARVNLIDGDATIFTSRSVMAGDEEPFARIEDMIQNAVSIGLDLRRQWVEYTQNLLALVIKMGF
mgnify:CR=1